MKYTRNHKFMAAALAILTMSGCQRGDTKTPVVHLNKTPKSYMTNLSARFDSLANNPDTDAYKTSDAVEYITYPGVKNTQMQAIQRDFILSSKLPLANAKLDISTHLPTENDFETGDSKYRSFYKANSSNEFIAVFRRNSASYIIRKYLIGHVDLNDQLRFYVDELLAAHSHNYALLYLSLKQLKAALGSNGIAHYKEVLLLDPAKPDMSEAFSQKLINKSRSFKGDTALALITIAKAKKASTAKRKYFFEKIKSI